MTLGDGASTGGLVSRLEHRGARGPLLTVAANALPLSCMSLFLKGWSSEFHIPISQIIVATIPMLILTSVLGAFVIGPLADKKPARLILARSAWRGWPSFPSAWPWRRRAGRSSFYSRWSCRWRWPQRP